MNATIQPYPEVVATAADIIQQLKQVELGELFFLSLDRDEVTMLPDRPADATVTFRPTTPFLGTLNADTCEKDLACWLQSLSLRPKPLSRGHLYGAIFSNDGVGISLSLAHIDLEVPLGY